MSDMLVKLYDLPDDWSSIAQQQARGILVRKPIGPEKSLIVDWVKASFPAAWASEADVAMSQRPISCFIALDGPTLVGFACYDATALGYFGPGGVAESHRQRGIGSALLRACLLDMKLKGYGYAIIGWAGPAEFYSRTVGATEIPGSQPGLYKTMLRQPSR